MSAGFSQNQRNTGGHRPPLQREAEFNMKRKKFAYVVVAVAAAGVTGVAQTKQVVAPPGLQIAGIPFSPGVKAGDLYHIAGTMGTDSGGRVVAGVGPHRS